MIRRIGLVLTGAVFGAAGHDRRHGPVHGHAAQGERGFLGYVPSAEPFSATSSSGVRSDYVEAHPTSRRLISAAIRGMLSSLDPPLDLSPAETTSGTLQVQTRGGVRKASASRSRWRTSSSKVVTPPHSTNTPAFEAGVLAGAPSSPTSTVRSVAGLTLAEAVERMRAAGQHAHRHHRAGARGVSDPIDIRIVRDTIRIRSVRWEPLGEDVGYIRIFAVQRAHLRRRPPGRA